MLTRTKLFCAFVLLAACDDEDATTSFEHTSMREGSTSPPEMGGAAPGREADDERGELDVGLDLGVTLIGDGTNQCEDCPQLGDQNEWGEVLVFSDDFIKDELDREVWTPEIGMVRNQEEQCYLDRPDNIIVRDGVLTLRGIRESPEELECFRRWESGGEVIQANYTSASLTTIDRAAFRFGRIEARLQVPSATGVWPAFWMMPQEAIYGGWPTSGEIDVMEHVSQEPNTVHGTVHFDFLGHASDGGQLDLPRPLHDAFHVYSINWTEERIDWFFDGELYHSFDLSGEIQGRTPFHESFYLLLNLAIGGHWPEDPVPELYPAEYRIDWVRVWQMPVQP